MKTTKMKNMANNATRIENTMSETIKKAAMAANKAEKAYKVNDACLVDASTKACVAEKKHLGIIVSVAKMLD